MDLIKKVVTNAKVDFIKHKLKNHSTHIVVLLNARNEEMTFLSEIILFHQGGDSSAFWFGLSDVKI